MTWTSAVGRSSKWLLYKIVHGLALTKISPNALTFIGLLINVVAGFLFGYANAENQQRCSSTRVWSLSAPESSTWSMAASPAPPIRSRSSAASSIPSSIAIATSRSSSDCWCTTPRRSLLHVVMVAFVMVSSVMVSYTRARAESLVQSCKAGFMERPERIVLVILGALFNRMGPVLWVIAVLSTDHRDSPHPLHLTSNSA